MVEGGNRFVVVLIGRSAFNKSRSTELWFNQFFR